MVVGVRARLAADDAVKHRTDHVLGALADLMTYLALGEDLLASRGVLRQCGAHRSKERRPRNRKTQQLHIVLPDLVSPRRPCWRNGGSRKSSLSNCASPGIGCPF